MKTKRNDPCPCGSGRKYKTCCQQADQARNQAAALLGAGAMRGTETGLRDAARGAEAWDADVVPIPVTISEARDGASLAMVMAGELMLTADIVTSRPGSPAERADAVLHAVLKAGRAAGGAFPPRLRVRDAALAEALVSETAARGIVVEAAGTLPELDEALDECLENVTGRRLGGRVAMPSSWRETEASSEELADLHRAAAEFWRAAPWDALEDGDVLSLEFPDGETFGTSVMGAAGMQYGVVLYAELDDLLDLLESGMHESAEEIFARMQGAALHVSFEPRGELPRLMRRELDAAGWEVAGPRAHPYLIGMHLPERRVAAAHVRRATLALRTLALLARDEDPEPETGVQVYPVLLDDDDDMAPPPEPAPVNVGEWRPIL